MNKKNKKRRWKDEQRIQLEKENDEFLLSFVFSLSVVILHGINEKNPSNRQSNNKLCCFSLLPIARWQTEVFSRSRPIIDNLFLSTSYICAPPLLELRQDACLPARISAAQSKSSERERTSDQRSQIVIMTDGYVKGTGERTTATAVAADCHYNLYRLPVISPSQNMLMSILSLDSFFTSQRSMLI